MKNKSTKETNKGGATQDLTPKPQITRVEKSLERFPGLWSLHQSDSKKVLKRIARGKDNNLIAQEITITPSPDGILTVHDQRTYYALVSLWEAQGKPHKISFSLRQLCERVGLTGGSKNLNVIKTSLRRLRMVHLDIRNAFWDARVMTRREEEVINILTHLRIVETATRKKGAKDLNDSGQIPFSSDEDISLHNEDRFDVIDDTEIPVMEQEFEKGSNLSRCSVVIHPAIQENLRLNYVRPILPDVIFSLKTLFGQLMYQYFDLMTARGNPNEKVVHFQVTTEKLFQQIDLYGEQYRQPSVRFQAIRKALEELKQVRVADGILSLSYTRRPDREYLITAKRIRAVMKVKPKESVIDLTDEYQAVNAFIETFDLKRKPRSAELLLARDIIDKHNLTLTEFNLFLSVALREAQQTSFRPGDFSGIVRYFSSAFEDIQQLRDQWLQDQKTANNQAVWEKMSEAEKDQFRVPIDEAYRTDLLEIFSGDEDQINQFLDRLAFTEFDRQAKLNG